MAGDADKAEEGISLEEVGESYLVVCGDPVGLRAFTHVEYCVFCAIEVGIAIDGGVAVGGTVQIGMQIQSPGKAVFVS